MYSITFYITVTILILSALTDLKWNKVFNFVTFPAMAAGLLLNGFPCSGKGYYSLFWMLVFFFLGQFRMMGMGDLKLCMAAIAMRGIDETAWMLLSGALLMFVYCFITDRANTILMLKDTYSTLFYHTPIIKRSDKEYPFALFLALGYIVNAGIRWWLYA